MFSCDDCREPNEDCRECKKYNNFWDSSPHLKKAKEFLPVLPRVKQIRGAGNFDFVCPECKNIENLSLPIFVKRCRQSKSLCKNCNNDYGTWGRRVQTTLLEHSPEIAKEWSKKNLLGADEVGHGTKKKYLWECNKCGYEWEESPNSRTDTKRKSRSACPMCKPRSVVRGLNDLATVRPEALEWWDDESDPSEYMGSSKKKVWLKCDKGHRFQRQVKRINKYCPQCSNGNTSLHTSKTFAEVASPEVLKQWSKKNEKTPEDYSYSSAHKVWWECEKGHEWETAIYVRLKNGCPYCYSTPQWEIELAELLESWNVDFIQHSRKVIAPFEVDFYLPEHNIAIELNGLYWHCDRHLNNPRYHYNKWKKCRDKGIQLITVWEDDWFNRKEIVLNAIKHKIGLSSQERIYARKTSVVELSKKDAESFLNAHHIQGFKSGSIYFGLEAENEIIAVAVYTISGTVARLDRYATSRIVVGGMGKLVKAVAEKFENVDAIETFASHEVSDGGLYEKLGFEKVKELKPDYMYIVGKNREHKFNYRKKRFREDPLLLWEDSLTESELAKLNYLDKTYDSGKTKYVLKLT